MNTERVPQIVLGVGAGAVLAGAAVLFVPGSLGGDGPPPAPGPVARAVSAAHAGAQASLPELAALIGDREKWLRAHPRDDASWAELGTAYVERGARSGDTASYVRAEKALKRSLTVLPAAKGNVDAQLGMGALANARGDFPAARKWGEAVRNHTPRRWQAYAVLIDAYSGLGDYVSAGRAMERLRALRPGAPALSRASLVHRDRGWREDASALAYDAVALAATPAEKAACLARLGDLAWERGEPAEAAASYEPALRLVPGHGPSLAGRARALAALGRADEAVRDYGAALEALPLPEYALEAGEFYESLGLDGDARTQYDMLRARAAEGAAHGVNETLVLARYETDHGDPAAAVTSLRAVWAKGQRSVHVADALGWALYRAGKPEEALGYARRATEQGLRSALFAYHRGQIERALGQYGAARRHIQEALRVNPDFSPLLAPKAREALAALGEPPEGGPRGDAGGGEEARGRSGSGAASGGGTSRTWSPPPRDTERRQPSVKPRRPDGSPSASSSASVSASPSASASGR
ncbi:tetratricopeptide repeat protein [Streptomyces ficellus]|uniref:Tetratricopeptide repeat protein n=1 Tax=Streptomyces ficellus TaxID=1977088 RepID=A0ABT7Z2G1_9ACTN|nr:tetratricopeptide repeat protein [Streptomyces ficellus]MDN3293679.1 tetratricopeptide repeat protein [Streptomyces ficellus]